MTRRTYAVDAGVALRDRASREDLSEALREGGTVNDSVLEAEEERGRTA